MADRRRSVAENVPGEKWKAQSAESVRCKLKEEANMRRPAKLEAPYPSIEEIAHVFGVPPSRVKEIVRLVDSIEGTSAHKTRRVRTASKRASYKRPNT